jgi:zinc protease
MTHTWLTPCAAMLLVISPANLYDRTTPAPDLRRADTSTPRADRRLFLPARADDTTLISYTVDSVRVIQRVSSSTDVVAVNLYLLGGSRQLTPATQGMEAMLLTASRYGTRSFPYSVLRSTWAMTGSDIASDIGNDWTMLGFRGIRDQFDASWNIVTERLTTPLLHAEGIKVSRARLVSSLRQARSNPDAEIGMVSDSVVFAGHPYALSPYGTEASLAAIDSAALAAYVRTQVVRSRMLLVVAGAATRAMVEAAVRRTLGQLPIGNYKWTPPPALPSARGTVTLIPRRTATNYLIGVFDGPPQTSDEFPSFRIATNFLGQLITEAVREKRGLSYAASAGVSDRAVVTGQIYVSTPRPDTVLKLIKKQIDAMLDPEQLPADIIFSNDKKSLTFLFRRSTSAAQVDALAQAELMLGDYRLADNVPRRMRSVSSGSMRAAVRKYVRDIRFVYAGDTTRVNRKSFVGF